MSAKPETVAQAAIFWFGLAVLAALIFILLVMASPSQAHNAWADGSKIPDWVKASCCGPADAHRLQPEQITRDGDYYLVEGYRRPIPVSQALPSQDGNYWVFYKDLDNGDQSGIYCLFVPMSF